MSTSSRRIGTVAVSARETATSGRLTAREVHSSAWGSGSSGTPGLCVAVCRQQRRVRFITATALINELAEATQANQLSRGLDRWERLDLICIDEFGYVPLAGAACELMFQGIAGRAEKAAVIVPTTLPFSEWSQVIPNPRLCKALIDR